MNDAAVGEWHAWYSADYERTYEDVAAHFGVTPNTVGKHFRRLELVRRDQGARTGKSHVFTANALDTEPRVGAVPGRIMRPSMQRRERRWR